MKVQFCWFIVQLYRNRRRNTRANELHLSGINQIGIIPNAKMCFIGFPLFILF